MSLTKICKALGISMRYGSPEQVLGVPFTGRGAAVMLDGTPYILCERNRPREETRYIIAHELGHILLGHLTFRSDPEKYPSDMEAEASIFAAVLLANELWSRESRE